MYTKVNASTSPLLGRFYRVFVVACILSSVNLSAGENAPERSAQSAQGSNSRVSGLLALSRLSAGSANTASSDSLIMLALKEARLNYDDDELLDVLNTMIELGFYRRNESVGDVIPSRVEELLKLTGNDALRWRSLMNLGSYHLVRFEYPQAYDEFYQAFMQSEQLDDARRKALSLLGAGQGLEGSNRKMEAFRHYLNAMYLARSLDDDSLLLDCFSTLSRFYNLNKVFGKAVEYKKRELEIIRDHGPGDSLSVLQLYLDLESISFNDRGEVNEDALLRILHYALKNNEQGLVSNSVALFRSALINSGKIGRLFDFYHHEHPELLASLKINEPLTHIRLKAFFSEYLDQQDSADHFYKIAAEQMELQGNMILRSHFFLRYAEYLLRTDRPGEALAKALMSLEYAENASSFDYILRSTDLLEDCYVAMGNYKEALHYALRSREVSDSIDLVASSDDLLALELSNAERMRELEAQQLEEETRRRHNIQYTGIIIAILTLFLILMMIGSFRVPRWTIQALGFISFIFFFEFLILLADHKIHHMTHGEPWKILAIKIVLIAILLPFHHWIEKRVVHYLLRRKLIDISRFSPGTLIGKLRPAKASAEGNDV